MYNLNLKCIVNEYSVFDMSQLLEGTTVTTTRGINHPTHEEATALNQVTNDIHISYNYYSCIIMLIERC